MRKQLILFDFDGTITSRDTLIEFIKYYHGVPKFIAGIILLSPWIAGLKLKIIGNDKVKERVLVYFFRGEPLTKFQNRCDQFSKTKIPELCRKSAMEMIGRFKTEGARIIVVSASPENWLEPWAKNNELEFIGTRLKVVNGYLTGKLEGKNCYGIEKVQRIKIMANLQEYENVIAFGDSEGDREMLDIAHQSYYRYFN